MLIETLAPPEAQAEAQALHMPVLDLLLAGSTTAARSGDLDSAGLLFPALQSLVTQALDELDYGMAIVNRQGRLMLANHCARRLFERPDGVCLLQLDRPVARHPAREEPLARAIQAAAQQGRRGLVAVGDDKRPQSVAVVPLGGLPVQGVLLVFGKAQMCEALSVDHYARVHGLTHAEGMVLAALCDGDTPAEVATRFGVAVSTVRTQISAIRQKTRCGSIRELVRRVAVLPPIVPALGRAPLNGVAH
ncbi:helix-turn-helix transcriptional regulator [Sphaerotilus mobilis]|nr:LuxR C-terminal-related transcriptional regulator [Sphaerotilus mobilis]